MTRFVIGYLILTTLVAVNGLALIDPSVLAETATHQFQYDSIDLSNLNIVVNIAVRAKPNTIPFSYLLQATSFVKTHAQGRFSGGVAYPWLGSAASA